MAGKKVTGGNTDLGRLLQARREALNMTRRDLVDATDLSYPYVSQLETGLRMPSSAAAKRLAAALGLTLDEIFAGPGPAGEKPTTPSGAATNTANPPQPHEIVAEVVRRIEELPADSRLHVLAEVQTQLMQNLVDNRIRAREASG